MYAVTAVVTRITGDYASVRSTPTFYLDPNVQGFTCVEGAEVVAREILAPFVRPEETVQVTVVNLDPPPPTRERPTIHLVRTEQESAA